MADMMLCKVSRNKERALIVGERTWDAIESDTLDEPKRE